MSPVFRRVRPALQHVLPVIEDLSGGGRLQKIDAAQEGGFSGAGGADDADDITVADGKVNVFEDLMGAEGLGQMIDLQN